jgi:cysteine desulfurase family protein (TIGR01976 family)
MTAGATAVRARVRALGVDDIRSQFPALARVENGHPVAYFDGPGGTQVPRAVGDAVADYLYQHNANTHWLYPTSIETDAMLLDARRAGADFFNATPEEISFGLNMTSITFHVARGLARAWRSGDEIVITELDHHGNIAPWRAVAQDHGLTVRVVRLDPETGRLDWSDLERALTRRTKLLAIGAASNALGTITDVAAAASLARAVGALVYVDAVHLAPHALIDVRAMDCDFLVCSAYKFYGPHAGMLFGKRDVVEACDVPRLEPAPQESPERLEAGTQNHEGIVGTAAAIDFIASLAGEGGSRRDRLARAFAELHMRGDHLLERLWSGLAAVGGLTLFGPPPGTPRTPTLSFSLRGVSSNDVARRLVPSGLYVSNGDFYATTVIERLGHAKDGIVRIGCSCYTTADEVDRVIAAVREIA